MPTVIELLFIDDNKELVHAMKLIFDHYKNELPPYKFFDDTQAFLDAITPRVQICVIDYYLPGTTGMDIVKKVTATNPQCWFIMFSGQQSLNVVADFMNNTQGSRYVEKGSNGSIDKLIFYIKDISARINTIEKYYLQSFKNREALGELKDSLIELKQTI